MAGEGEIEKLNVYDYVVFATMLLFSTAIGFYYAFTGGRQRTQGEFLMANRSMGVVPVALSLLASFMSAITLLGTPATMYQYGTQYWMIGPSYIVVCAVAAHVFLPVFYRLDITSIYEYLELRFSRVVRLLGCATFMLQMIIYMGIVLYAPALALSAVTGLDWRISVLIIGGVCTLYTTIGGIKAVMWTDVLQITIMFGGMITVGVVGTYKAGGFQKVWDTYGSTGRLELWNFDPDPTVRHTVWSLAIGGIFTWLTVYGVNQSQVQRYLTCPSLRQAQWAIWLNLPGLWGLLTVCAYTGIVAFSYYYNVGCDPLFSKTHIRKPDQILPLFVMEVLPIPGFRGLFVAAIFSGALSTISSGVNALAAVTLEDLIKPAWSYISKKELNDALGAKLAKIMAVAFGILSLAMAFVASKMGSVLAAALGLFGIVGGPLLGTFLLGLLFPCANWQGAVAGHIFGEMMSLWIGVGSFIYKVPKERFIYNNTLCPNYLPNVTDPFFAPVKPYQGLIIYKISYMWQGAWAVLWTILMGLIVSAVFRWEPQERRRPELVFPLADTLCCCLPQGARRFLRGADAPSPQQGKLGPAGDTSGSLGVQNGDSTAYLNPSFGNGDPPRLRLQTAV